ncbi:regulator [Herbaspirillum rubrisubalbicans]|jgi:HD-like signal output (HDOD) protein|uniref:Regulator n=2 Tax=Herbaspirillum rubrisubalbicans TaxID=80842 RepID=A0ABX9BVU0_9BURK|nr:MULTISPECIES: HDOD domain-containing protein [Herbaspirillum]MCP1576563.1 HD-like signal output (HDOD) protein [Herbaspirillum rubrisubalbicans]NQE51638.1 regulator [Herbaspirillum rubrisubalbicans]QJP99789.1 HDOD domain-containing protein [Herbaspirillum rubrisubalbicans Os34]RAM61903.1 regulator [Herbaspirillum rubrisubalbicans]RAN43022.1 regulator [Herbaspirillum rubrisubalbicans]
MMLTFIEPTLFEKLRSAQALPSPGGVRLTIMRMCAQDDPDMAELIHLVQADPALSGRIIRIVNVLNAERVRPIASVSMDSMLLVGLQAVRQLALALSLAETTAPASCTNFKLPAFWAHSFAMACGAQAISGHTRVAPLGEMFTTGLLANIGKLTLASAHPSAYSSLLTRPLDASTQLTMEQSLFGFNHLNIAAALMQDWKIPELFCDAVLHYEAPVPSEELPAPRSVEITWTLYLATAMAELGCAAPPVAEAALHKVARALPQLQLAPHDFPELYQQAGEDWQDWTQTMHITGKALWQGLPAQVHEKLLRLQEADASGDAAA